MGFQQGLAGLNAAARNLDAIGNNVANANTVGFKSSRAEFADVYATSLGGSRSTGLGVAVGQLAQQFTQGDLTTSNNSLDMAINGRGFFRFSQDGITTYSRNGQMQLDKNGYIVNAQGGRLTGFPVDANGRINGGVPQELKMDTSDILPRQTSSGEISVNLASTEQVSTVPFDSTNPSSYASATSLSVYDSLGRDHSLAVYFRKTAGNTWEIYGTTDGAAMGATPLGTLGFTSAGAVDPATSTTPLVINVPVGADAGGVIPVTFDLSQTTQYGQQFSVAELKQDGYSTGRLSGFNVADDGTILARYSNGQTPPLGKIAIANFINPQGLESLGGNQWAESIDSGAPMVGSPGAGSLGTLKSGALEQSNVDLTAELVNMITAQRVYQANAQTVKTQDQLLQTIVNLR
ncbi:MAG: flagellar hook protein FlgE [Lautropia sp.]